jgi:hypothetical protein
MLNCIFKRTAITKQQRRMGSLTAAGTFKKCLSFLACCSKESEA